MARDFYREGNVALEGRYVDLENEKTSQPRILLVDDDPVIGETLKAVLEMHQFQVIGAGNLADALHLIDTQVFDVLLSDLHMPGAADGLAVMSAMRHEHPDVIVLLFTGYLAFNEAMDAILLQADEILVKPMPIDEMVALIRDRLAKRVERRRTNNGRVASILERDILPTVANRLFAVKTDDELPHMRLSDE
jgi:DNA-binding NtrC family response regulator